MIRVFSEAKLTLTAYLFGRKNDGVVKVSRKDRKIYHLQNKNYTFTGLSRIKRAARSENDLRGYTLFHTQKTQNISDIADPIFIIF